MDTPIVVAIIGAFVSLGGIWLNHYLAIQREFLFRGLPEQQDITRTESRSEGSTGISALVSRKTVLRDWYRAVLAIATCPLVDILVFITICSPLWGGFWDFFMMLDTMQAAPWFYATCIIILLPVLLFFYRRVARNRARLIFAVASWSALTALYVFFYFVFVRKELSFGSTGMGVISGCVSGLVYWLITYRSFSRPNADQITQIH
jgi:hypothetical protein